MLKISTLTNSFNALMTSLCLALFPLHYQDFKYLMARTALGATDET